VVAEASDDVAAEVLVVDMAWVQAETVCVQTVVIGNLINEAFLVIRGNAHSVVH
jgi:hypothetical protein